ncbi:MAG: hypothetical protein IJ094_00095 [Bacilli bacterium]|nr:hypothetical protein [Bacilli bacterium]
MDIKGKKLLSEYMDILYRITVAEYWFNVEGNIKNHGKGCKEHTDFCNLLYRMRDLYIGLRELNINPPRWIDDNISIDKLIQEYKGGNVK